MIQWTLHLNREAIKSLYALKREDRERTAQLLRQLQMNPDDVEKEVVGNEIYLIEREGVLIHIQPMPNRTIRVLDIFVLG